MEQAGRATWTAKPRRVAASESEDERGQSQIIISKRPPHARPEMLRLAQHYNENYFA
jgi:hypothetical protein